MIKPIAKPFHASDLEEQRGQRRREIVYRNEEGYAWRAGNSGGTLDLQGKGRRGLPLPNHGPSVHADRHLPKSQKADKREGP